MEILITLFNAAVLGVVEGISEWLPISSTGHLILAEKIFPLAVTPAFKEMFDVVIQLGAILAVVVIYWSRLWPFTRGERGGIALKPASWSLWFKVLVATLPAIVIGLPFDDFINETFFNPGTIAITLILYGIFFILFEHYHRGKRFSVRSIPAMTYSTALGIGLFQVLALIPGTSRSGATILGAMLLGVSRKTAAEFTFFLAVPVMCGASLLKVIKFGLEMGFAITGLEMAVLLVGMAVAFVVSVFAIRFLVAYVQRNDFKIFGWYRIVLGIVIVIVGFVSGNGLFY